MPMPTGVNWIVGGVAAAVLLPLLAIGLGLPFLVAGGASLLAGGGLVALLAPRSPFEALETSGIARGRITLVRELLTEATPLVQRMQAATDAIKTPAVADRVRRLGKTAERIIEALQKDPMRLDRVRRFFTYYLPRTVEIAEAYGALESSVLPDAGHLVSARTLLDRLDQAFTKYAASLQDADLDKLDIDLKLLKSSLDDDLGPQTAAPALPPQKGA